MEEQGSMADEEYYVHVDNLVLMAQILPVKPDYQSKDKGNRSSTVRLEML